MSLEHSPNPFNNPEFRKEMSEMLDDKLINVLSTQDDHGKRITALEVWRWILVGAIGLAAYVVRVWAGR